MQSTKIRKVKFLSSDNFSFEESGLDPDKLPVHVAVIMDGNGRWAKKKLLNRVKGHEKGVNSVRDIVSSARKIGISYLTLYAFSTENWGRPKAEVSALMKLLKKFLINERDEMMDKNIRFISVGKREQLPDSVLNELIKTEELTKNNSEMVLNIALSYGSRSEIVDAVKSISDNVKNGSLNMEDISEELISDNLYTKDLPDPDLLIRTSGEMRISNFLMWQISYSEIFFSQTLWPDFTEAEFINILKNYQNRDRRFGKVK